MAGQHIEACRGRLQPGQDLGAAAKPNLARSLQSKVTLQQLLALRLEHCQQTQDLCCCKRWCSICLDARETFCRQHTRLSDPKLLTSALAYMQNTGDCSRITAALMTEMMLIHNLCLMPHVMYFICINFISVHHTS